MKYIIPDADDRNQIELQFKPQDDDGPDHELWVGIYDEHEDPIAGLYCQGLHIKVSQLYEFMDWLKNWAPDPRKK